MIGALSAPTEFFWHIFMTGFAVGVAQWLVLRHYLSYAGWWILASGFGWFLGIMVSIMTRGITAPIIELLESVIRLRGVFWLNVVDDTVNGAVLGVAQWLVLRRHTQHAGWWVLASIIGRAVDTAVRSAVSAVVASAIDGAVYGAVRSAVGAVVASAVRSALSSGAGWAGNGAVTGIMLVWLLRNGTKMELNGLQD